MSYKCFGAVLVCVALAIVKSEYNARKPIGPKMCLQLCNHQTGCSHFVFMTSDLSCHLTDKQSISHAPQNGLFLVKIKERTYTGERCEKNSKVFLSNRHHLLCRRPCQTQRREVRMTRLLILPPFSSSTLNQGRQLYLNNYTVVKYPLISLGVNAVVYISALRKLAIATMLPRDLTLISLDGRNKTSIINNIDIFRLAVDQSKLLVFMITLSPPRGISVITTEGKDLTLLARTKRKMCGIAVDPKHSLIFTSSGGRKIYIYNYQGMFQNTVSGRSFGDFLFFDSERDLLLYLKGNPSTVFSMSVSDRRYKHAGVINLKCPAAEFYFTDSRYYVVPVNFKGNIFVVSENGMRAKIRSGYRSSSTVRLCAIP